MTKREREYVCVSERRRCEGYPAKVRSTGVRVEEERGWGKSNRHLEKEVDSPSRGGVSMCERDTRYRAR